MDGFQSKTKSSKWCPTNSDNMYFLRDVRRSMFELVDQKLTTLIL